MGLAGRQLYARGRTQSSVRAIRGWSDEYVQQLMYELALAAFLQQFTVTSFVPTAWACWRSTSGSKIVEFRKSRPSWPTKTTILCLQGHVLVILGVDVHRLGIRGP